MSETEKNPAAVYLGRLRWAGKSIRTVKRAMAKARAARKPGQQSRAAAAISPEAARERSLKAQATRKRNRETAAAAARGAK